MSFASPPDIAKFARSTGLLIDRCMQREQPIATLWMVGDNKVVTCAHNVVLYLEFLAGLKVRFPGTGQEWEVKDATFHPKFDQAAAMELAQRSLIEPVPAMALQDHNICILELARGLKDLDQETRTTFNRKISAAPPVRQKGLLAGPVEELGLALVVQTIANARKDGNLVISDERNRPLAKMFCREGKVIYAKYGTLLNEAAIYQMFSDHITGQFHFQQTPKPDWPVNAAIERNPDNLLLEAHRRMDEIPNLLLELGGEGAAYMRAVEVVNYEVLSAEVQYDVEALWPYLDGGVSIDHLWEIVGLDNYAVYKALEELYRTRQIIELPFMEDDGLSPMMPLELAPHMLLSPWDEVSSLTVHMTTGRAQVRQGHLVGLIRPNDPWHLLHSIMLPYRGAGCPIFKKGQVVGMHCGLLPLDPKLHGLPHLFSQMIWVESIHQMLSAPAKSIGIKPGKKSIGMRLPEFAVDGPKTQGRIQCSKCSSWMVKQAKFCGTCGQKMLAL